MYVRFTAAWSAYNPDVMPPLALRPVHSYDSDARKAGVNPLPTNDALMRHDLCKLSISLWEFI